MRPQWNSSGVSRLPRNCSFAGPWDIIVDEASLGWRVVTQGDYFDQDTLYPDTGM
jgi:hypothetical protein